MEHSTIVLIVLGITMVLFILEKTPLGVTAVSSLCVLVVLGVINPNDAFKGFINNTVVLITAMCIVGGALFETGMASKIGGLVTVFAKTEKQAVVWVFIISGVLSGFLNNAACHVCLAPVVAGVAAKGGYSRSRVMIGLLFGGVLGANLTLLGQPHNMYAQGFLMENNAGEYGFFELAEIGIPIMIVTCLYLATIGYWLMPAKVGPNDPMGDRAEGTYDHVPPWKQWASLAVLGVTVIAIIFEKQIGIRFHIIAVIGAMFLVLAKVMTEKEAYGSVAMNVLLLLGGMLGIAAALSSTGAGKIIADFIIGLFGENPSPFMIMLALMLVATILTNLMSNNATSSMLLPIGISVSLALDINMKTMLTAIIIGASLACGTPIGMPTNPLITSYAGYTFRDTVKVGMPLVVILFVMCAYIIPMWMPF